MRRPLSRRARTDRERPVPVLLKGFSVFALLGALGVFAASAINGVPGRHYGTTYVEVAEKGSIINHDAVRIAGVQVGQVLAVANTPSGGARIELQLGERTHLPEDTKVIVRANGLLGARYVQLVPGRSAKMLADGQTIRGGVDSLTSGLPEALDTFDARTRAALGSMINGLGEGLAGNGQRLNHAVPESNGAMKPFQQLVGAILARPGAAERLLPSLDRGLVPLDANRVPAVASYAFIDRGLRPFVDRRSDIRRTLDLAPSALTAADGGLSDGRRLLEAARQLSASAAQTLPPAPASLRAASRLLMESRAPLKSTEALLREVSPTVPAVLKVTSSLDPALGRLNGILADLSPMVSLVGRHGCDIVNFGTSFRSMTGFAGTGEGPAGPAMAFRLQATNDPPVPTGKIVRDGYPAPCKYLQSAYPAVETGTGR